MKKKFMVLLSVMLACMAANAAVDMSVVSDSCSTYAIYHFDEIDSGITPDDNSAGFRTAKNMTAIADPSIVDTGIYPGDNPAFAGCADFDGVSDYFEGPTKYYIDPSNFRVQTWIKMAPGWNTMGQLCWIANYDPMFRFYLEVYESGPRLTWIVWDDVSPTVLTIPCGEMTDWTHVAADFYQGQMTLYINGEIVGTATANEPTATAGGAYPLRIGCQNSSSTERFFWGKMDEFCLTQVVADCSKPGVYEDDLATYGLYHFESQTTVAPDDNSANMRSPRDITVFGTPELVTNAGYPNDDEAFGNSVYFDGITDYYEGPVGYGINLSNFKVETWVKADPGWLSIGGKLSWIANYDPVFRLYMQNNVGNPIINWIVWDSTNTATVMTYPCGSMTEWTHVAADFYNGKMTLYINGIKVAGKFTPNPTANKPASYPVRIGCNNPGAMARVFWGWMDEFRISKAVYECGDLGYPAADINKDCVVDFADMSVLAADWMQCTFEGDIECVSLK